MDRPGGNTTGNTILGPDLNSRLLLLIAPTKRSNEAAGAAARFGGPTKASVNETSKAWIPGILLAYS